MIIGSQTVNKEEMAAGMDKVVTATGPPLDLNSSYFIGFNFFKSLGNSANNSIQEIAN